MRALKDLPPPSDERLAAFLTRTCTDVLPVTSEPPPPADNENQAGHEWPVMDLVLENALLDHEDAALKAQK